MMRVAETIPLFRARLLRRIQQKGRRTWQRATCRFVPYPLAVLLVRAAVRNPIGRRRARRRAVHLLQLLDEAGIAHDEKDTVVRAAMAGKLFPWAYCRFVKCPSRELMTWVKIEGMENLQPLLDGPGGVLLATCHFGPGHAAKYALAELGYRIHNIRANRSFILKYGLGKADRRLSSELHVKRDRTAGFLQTMVAVRDLLRDGETVTCALDGRAGTSEGIEMPLLGRRRTFRTALPLVAALTGARIVTYFATLQRDGSIALRFDPPFPEYAGDQPPLAYAESIVRAYVDRVQAFGETQPAQIKPNHLKLRWEVNRRVR